MQSSLACRELSDEIQIDHQAIRQELARVLESPMFAQSERLARFLRFTVETTLAGGAATLKEYLIGTEVYDRRPPYHPSVDSIVRSEARRLRNKLREYYESVGKDDPVFIYYRTGSYVPAFRLNRAEKRSHVTTSRNLNEILAEELIAQTLDLSPGEQEFEIQIIFEGTVRVVRSGQESLAPVAFSPEKNIWGRSSTPMIVSVPVVKPVRMRTPRHARPE